MNKDSYKRENPFNPNLEVLYRIISVEDLTTAIVVYVFNRHAWIEIVQKENAKENTLVDRNQICKIRRIHLVYIAVEVKVFQLMPPSV